MSEPKQQGPIIFNERAATCEAYAIVPVGVSMLKTVHEDLGKQTINACVYLARWQFDQMLPAYQALEAKLADKDILLGWHQNELRRLHKVIAKEVSENDELGCEFTYVNCLRRELSTLTAIIAEQQAALQYMAADDIAVFDCPPEVRSYILRARATLKSTEQKLLEISKKENL